MTRMPRSVFSVALIVFGVVAFPMGSAWADPPTVGSINTATADPIVPPPYTTPCVVTLFENQQFADYNTKPFSYTPPAACPGPWQKVVLTGDYSVTMGRQFDRTSEIWLGGAILFFGTTSEPSATFGPSWEFQRDVTDYSALLTQAQTGNANLGNFVGISDGVDYTGILYGTATLSFYPLAPTVFDNPPRPDVVLPISASADGSTATLNTSTDQLTATFTLPRNIERAFLDVYAQSQSGDEFWYTCVPDDVASELESCTGTGFREAEVSIDGQPAGVAPIYPWIFTGGLDPFLWSPTPGVQTLSFEPYRVDLTPFAGALDDGNPHTVAISVFNADSYFSAAANLLLYLDHAAATVSGGVTSNTLAAPAPNAVENLSTDASGNVTGTVTVTSNRQFTIAGSVTTSHGTVNTQVQQTLAFSNAQTFDITDSVYSQHITQGTTIDSTTTVTSGATSAVLQDQRSYPLTVNIDFAVAGDGTSAQTTVIDQELSETVSVGNTGFTARTASLDDHVTTTDALDFDAAGNFSGNSGQSSSQTYSYADPYGDCYNRQIASAAGVLTAVTDGTGCAGGSNSLSFFDPFYTYGSSVFGATVELLP
jgi:Peptide N-acetyl-beta-D-glucosaminyl asparaginase amidase A